MPIVKPLLDLSALTHLRIQNLGIRNAWLVGLPRMLWNHSGARKERKAIIDNLTKVFPSRSIWLTELATDEGAHWRHLAPADDILSAGDLDHGGWALFFFPADSAVPDLSLDGLAIDAASAALQLHQLSARAAITSLVDDDEWIVAVAEY